MGLRQRFGWCVSAALCVLGACVESHDIEAPGAAGSGGNVARGGSGGRSGSGGRATSGSGGSGTGNTSIECGGETCSGSAFFGMPCCTDDDKCGIDVSSFGLGMGCNEMNAPGTADASCPGMNLAGFFMLEGCCRPDGTCGVLDTFAGLGCTALGGQAMTCDP